MDIDAIKQAFYKSLVKLIGLNNKQPNIERFAIDYTLLLSFGGMILFMHIHLQEYVVKVLMK